MFLFPSDRADLRRRILNFHPFTDSYQDCWKYIQPSLKPQSGFDYYGAPDYQAITIETITPKFGICVYQRYLREQLTDPWI